MKSILFVKSVLISTGIAATLLSAGASADTAAERFVGSKHLTSVERIMPSYPRRANLLAIEGHTVVEFTVLPDGSVAEPLVATTSHTIFGDAVAQAISNWKFEPVIDGGTAVPVRTAMRFQFTGAD